MKTFYPNRSAPNDNGSTSFLLQNFSVHVVLFLGLRISNKLLAAHHHIYSEPANLVAADFFYYAEVAPGLYDILYLFFGLLPDEVFADTTEDGLEYSSSYVWLAIDS